MKLWCENCRGGGKIIEGKSLNLMFVCETIVDCLHCNGKGYVNFGHEEHKIDDVIGRKRFFIDLDKSTMCYPFKTSRFIEDFGVLKEYQGKFYTLEEINKIIAKLIVKTPYVKNSMSTKIWISYVENNPKYGNIDGAFHILEFQNYKYAEQQRQERSAIEFLY